MGILECEPEPPKLVNIMVKAINKARPQKNRFMKRWIILLLCIVQEL